MNRSFVSSYPSHSLPAGALSALVHLCFFALLFFGMQWQNHTPVPVQAELWSGMPAPSKMGLPPPAAPIESPAAPAPDPEAVKPPPPPPPAPAPAPVVKPDIATERLPKPPLKEVPPKKADEALKEIERLKQQEAKLREFDKLRELDKEAREKKARDAAMTAQAQKEAAEEKRLAQQQREADARAAQSQADAASRNQQLLQSYIERIQAKIKSNTLVPPSVASGITLTIKFVVLPDGSVLEGSVRVVQSSGQSAYDDAVQRAIIASQPLPMPEDPALRRQMRDVTLKTTNLN